MEIKHTIFENISLGLEIVGAMTIVLGGILAIIRAIELISQKANIASIYKSFRKTLGEGILLGLEFLVAADIINSVAVEPTFNSIGVLGLIVLVRTFLSFTLEVEMNGHWPWQAKKIEHITNATQRDT